MIMNCIICGSDKIARMPLINEISRYTKVKYPLYKCKKCGFTRPSPLPYEDESKLNIYDKPENIKFFDKKLNKIDDGSKEYKYYFKHFKPYIELIKKYKIRGKAIDVGCGPGHLLELMSKEGLKAEGSDISPVLIKVLNKKFKVYCAELDSKEIKKKEYDLVTLNQVIEHVEDPELFVNQINRVLKIGGHLILATPYLWGIVPQVLRSKWYGLGYGQHLNFFSSKSMKMIMERNGFKIKEIKILSVDYAHPNFPKILNVIANFIMKMNVYFGLGDNMFVIAEKVSEVKK